MLFAGARVQQGGHCVLFAGAQVQQGGYCVFSVWFGFFIWILNHPLPFDMFMTYIYECSTIIPCIIVCVWWGGGEGVGEEGGLFVG